MKEKIKGLILHPTRSEKNLSFFTQETVQKLQKEKHD